MDLEAIRAYCLDLPGTTEGFPFGEDVLVFKVMGKMYLLMNLERVPSSVNVKCDPERALELRERWPQVTPGYHMSKKHWNTIALDGGVPSETIAGWIDDSYGLVVKSLRKKDREALAALAKA